MRAVLASVWAEAAMILALISDVLLFVAILSIGWGVPRDPSVANIEGLGLWRQCSKTGKRNQVRCETLGQYNLPEWFTAVKGLVMASLIGLFLSFIIICMYACCQRFSQDRRLLVAYGLTTLVFASVGLAGVIVFGENIGALLFKGVLLRVSWSYIVAAVGVGTHYLCVTLVGVEVIIGPRRDVTSSDTRPVVNDAADMATSAPPVCRESVA